VINWAKNISNYTQSASFVVAAHSTIDTPCGCLTALGESTMEGWHGLPSIMTLAWKWRANGCRCSMAGEYHAGHRRWKTERSKGQWRWSFLQTLKTPNGIVKLHGPSNQLRPHHHIILFVNSLKQAGPVKTAANGPGWGKCKTCLKPGMARVIYHQGMYLLNTAY
jgi:hypothetical protein